MEHCGRIPGQPYDGRAEVLEPTFSYTCRRPSCLKGESLVTLGWWNESWLMLGCGSSLCVRVFAAALLGRLPLAGGGPAAVGG